MHSLTFQPLPFDDSPDTLKIDRKTNATSAKVRTFSYVDKDTNQYVCVIPSLDVSGYGSTKDRAQEMLNFSVKELLTYFLDIDVVKMSKELETLGWHKNPLLKKEFSKAYIDGDGELKGFNALGGNVERSSLHLAA